jgi:hypothetical protein
MKPVQLKMALAALGITIPRAAEISGVSKEVIDQIEAGRAVDQTKADKLRRALESAGIEFIDENGGVGVIFRGGPMGDSDAAISIDDLNSENDD